jgi:hypothetical protein
MEHQPIEPMRAAYKYDKEEENHHGSNHRVLGKGLASQSKSTLVVVAYRREA